METLKYKVIKSKSQYKEYCLELEELVGTGSRSHKDQVELLTLLIQKWDADHNTFNELDPVQLLQALMKDHQVKAKDLAEVLNMSKGYVSDILGYKKGFSKEVIRRLSGYFGVSQEAFNRPYGLNQATRIITSTQRRLTALKKTGSRHMVR